MEMRKIDLESVEVGMKRFFELFNLILEASDYNLDRFVEGNMISIEDPSIGKYKNEFQEMLEELTKICIASKEKELFETLETVNEAVEIDNFIEWLSGYAETAVKPYQETSFIRKMDLDNFTKVVEYCFDNFVLVENGRENIDSTICEESELIILRKLIFTIADLVIVNNYSKNYVYSRIATTFEVDSSYIDVIWELIQKNEDKMWKIMLMRKLQRMEQKIDMLCEG